jgi:hypothetical protein
MAASPSSIFFRGITPTKAAGTVVAGGLAAGIYYKFFAQELRADSASAPRKVFSGGPAFVSLPLESSEQVNHNTKRLRFSLPSSEAVSGLPLTCEFSAVDSEMKRSKTDLGMNSCVAHLFVAQGTMDSRDPPIHTSQLIE